MEASSLLQVVWGSKDEASPDLGPLSSGVGEGEPRPHPGAPVPWARDLGSDPAGLTRNLYSARLRMTPVICWSMKMRIDNSRAGRAAATLNHQGLAPKGDTSQPRPGSVGWGRGVHGQVGEAILRTPHLHTPAMAFFHNVPLPTRSKTLDARWEQSVCTAGSAHPRARMANSRRTGTSLGVGLEPGTLDFDSQGPSLPARGGGSG